MRTHVSWHWKNLTELDQLWMLKCLRFNWYINVSPTAYEQGVWKKHYIQMVKELHVTKPKTPPKDGFVITDVQPIRSSSPGGKLSSSSAFRSSSSLRKKNHPGEKELPPWRSSDKHPTDIICFNYLDNRDPIEHSWQGDPLPYLLTTPNVDIKEISGISTRSSDALDQTQGCQPDVEKSFLANVLKPNLTKLMNASQQSKRNRGATKPEIVDKEGDTDITERAPQEQINHDHLSFVDGTHKNNRSDSPEKYPNVKVEEEKKHKSSEVEVSDNVCDTADESGLIQQGKSGGNSNQEFAAMENEAKQKIKCKSNYDSHGKEVKKKDNSKWTPEECVIAPIFEKTDSLTGGLLHVNDDSILSEVDQDDDRPAKIKSNENNKVKEQINSVDDLNDLTQSSETASEDVDLSIGVSDSCEEAKDLLCKNHMLQDEIAMQRLEIDAVKHQHQEKEKKYFDDIEIVKGKNDDLQKAIKLNEEMSTKTISQYVKSA
ncbi:hypothetical protein MJG53_011460 [Ovis ammon polii x Ovis aries]|uniref:Uncharacterized protein n=1 Tax=Ovis ammon polii x Ovis aries TaxID=2918886 RepID=A0ACB9UNV0_9CETA|nr:hypothetical protein MJT46_011080 [Ovis ammon polii x Ovis aries]KAI4575257.1 hypothetical protein MJG53_011460 [Ovis ammon polii x Ovis aries]